MFVVIKKRGYFVENKVLISAYRMWVLELSEANVGIVEDVVVGILTF